MTILNKLFNVDKMFPAPDSSIKGEALIFDLVCPDFSESCGNMQYLLGDGALYILFMILLIEWYVWAYCLIHRLCP